MYVLRYDIVMLMVLVRVSSVSWFFCCTYSSKC
jgi:hypothetical protein